MSFVRRTKRTIWNLRRRGGVAVRGHLDGGVIQMKSAGVAVLSGDLHFSVQLLENLLHVIGVAGLGDGVDISLGVHPHLVLLGHVQQIIEPPAPGEILGGDAAGVVIQGQLIHLVDTKLVQRAVGVLLHRDGVVAAVLAGSGLLHGQGWEGQGSAKNQCGNKQRN